MQPNGQYQPPAPNPNIPEYLHMEPIADPVIEGRKRSKRLLYVGLALLVVVIVALAGAFVLWYLNYNSPQEKLYRALANNLQISYVVRDFKLRDATLLLKENTYKVETDLSNPVEPKSHLTYSDSRTSVDGKKSTINGEKIVVGKDEYYDKITGVETSQAIDGVVLNQWRVAALNSDTGAITYYYDGIDSLRGLNSTQGVVLTGNFSVEQRNQLISFIKANGLYGVVSAQTRLESGNQVTDYVVKLDVEKINQLNKKAVDLLGTGSYATLAKNKQDAGDLHIVVDDKTDRISGIIYRISKDGKTIFEKTVTMTYPDTLSINKPASMDGN